MPSTREMILSEDYADIIVPLFPCFLNQYREQGAQVFNDYYGMIHYPLSERSFAAFFEEGFFYTTVPKLYTLLDTVNLDAAGITKVQNQPVLNLTGQDIILGFIDTGIDYTHPAFRRSDGTSRICGLWDQTVQSGKPPYDLEYAGIAGGSTLPENDFNGAAPQSMIAVVKLKTAKKYLKTLFYVTGDAPAYQMSDIMAGIRYLLRLSEELVKPLVICLGLGTSQGDHSGDSPLDSMFSVADQFRGFIGVAAAGNEAGRGHHYYGTALNSADYNSVEILVQEGTRGFCAELWGQPPEVYAVGFESPLGEVVQKIPPRLSYSENISFILENTRIFVSSEIIQTISGSQLIFIRFTDPTPGSWKIRVYTSSYNSGSYHIWLPITGFSDPDVTFLEPNPETTLTSPGSAVSVITTAAYNAYTNSLYLNSSRGYTRTGQIKPDIAAPGVNVFAPALRGRYTAVTGTSAAAAITAGACALIMEWGMNRTPSRIFNNAELKSLFIRGAQRRGDLLYPNREWGYGTLDVYQVFSALSSP